MGLTKVMIIRHAEKPGIYNKVLYNGIDGVGQQDPASLVTMGWERAGGIANLFCPGNGLLQPPLSQYGDLSIPNYIYASNPHPRFPGGTKTEYNGNIVVNETSQRPYQTISALSAKMADFKIPVSLNITYAANSYAGPAGMVADVLSSASPVVLIAWQHQDILPQPNLSIPGSILTEFLNQTNTTGANALKNIPPGPWPPDRYDMVFVLDRPTGSGPFTSFTQVPQQLLAGDKVSPIGFPKTT